MGGGPGMKFRFRVVRHGFCDYTVECQVMPPNGGWSYVNDSVCFTFWGALLKAKRLKKNGGPTGKQYWYV